MMTRGVAVITESRRVSRCNRWRLWRSSVGVFRLIALPSPQSYDNSRWRGRGDPFISSRVHDGDLRATHSACARSSCRLFHASFSRTLVFSPPPLPLPLPPRLSAVRYPCDCVCACTSVGPPPLLAFRTPGSCAPDDAASSEELVVFPTIECRRYRFMSWGLTPTADSPFSPLAPAQGRAIADGLFRGHVRLTRMSAERRRRRRFKYRPPPPPLLWHACACDARSARRCS